MISAVAVCPPAPWLIPGVAERLAAAGAEVKQACLRAVPVLAGASRVVIVSAAPGTVAGVTVLPPGSRVADAGLTRSDIRTVPRIRLAGGATTSPRDRYGAESAAPPASPEAPAGGRPTIGTCVGAWLLSDAGMTTPATAFQVAPGSGTSSSVWPSLPPGARRLLATEAPERVGLLVMVDGAACHGDDAPGGDDPRAAAFDDELAAALARPDPARLRETCRRLAAMAGELRAETLPALSVAADLIEHAAAGAAGGAAHAELVHRSAPFGVGYLVAAWCWDERA